MTFGSAALDTAETQDEAPEANWSIDLLLRTSDLFDVPPLQPDVQAELLTPALLVWPDRISANIDRMIQIAGSPERLRPHCKTHKMLPVVQRLLQSGVTRHKAATVVEVDMLCRAGATDIVLAGNPVGPSLIELIRLATEHSDTTFAITADNAAILKQASKASSEAGLEVGVLLGVDVGLHRTGVDPSGADAGPLYRLISDLPGLRPAGLHIYDGHQHQTDREERTSAIHQAWQPVEGLLNQLKDAQLPVPELLCGGTPSFPVYAAFDDPRVRLSPGTCTLHDVGYGRCCPDLVFDVAAAVATRVVSSAVAGQLTLDVGHKAIAGDPPAGSRVFLPALPDAQAIIHNEEHLTVTTQHADRYQPGDLLMALPIHVCPTVALHSHALVVHDGRITDEWPVARHRRLRQTAVS